MLAERYKRHRYEVGKAEERARNRARNRRFIAKLREWNEERIEAAEKGEPFDKPMPEPDYDDDEEVA